MQVIQVTCTKGLMSNYRTRDDLVKQFNEDYKEMRINAKLRDYGLLRQVWNDTCDTWRKSGLINPNSRGYIRGWNPPQWVSNAPQKEWFIDRKAKSIRVVLAGRTILSVTGKQAQEIFDSWDGVTTIMRHVQKKLKGVESI